MSINENEKATRMKDINNFLDFLKSEVEPSLEDHIVADINETLGNPYNETVTAQMSNSCS